MANGHQMFDVLTTLFFYFISVKVFLASTAVPHFIVYPLIHNIQDLHKRLKEFLVCCHCFYDCTS